MRRLWGRANSVNVQKALWGLDESGLAYERVEAGGAHGVVADPAYRAMNPNGLVPVLEEWWQSFPGPFLYTFGRRQMPAPLRAFIDYLRDRARGG